MKGEPRGPSQVQWRDCTQGGRGLGDPPGYNQGLRGLVMVLVIGAFSNVPRALGTITSVPRWVQLLTGNYGLGLS